MTAGPTEARFLSQSSSASHFTARRLRVLELEPVRRPARSVARSQPLRDDSLQPHLAGVLEDRQPQSCSRCSFRRAPRLALRRMLASVALRTSIGSRRRSVPFSSKRSKAQRKALGSFRLWCNRARWQGFPTLLFLHKLTLFRGLRSAFVDVLNPVDRLAAVVI